MARTRSKSQYPQAFLDLLKAAGFSSPHALAVAVGNPDALRNFASGKSRSIRADTLQAIANQLGQSMDVVSEALGLPMRQRSEMEPVGQDPRRFPLAAAPILPVRFAVQAGAWIERDDLVQSPFRGPPVSADPSYPREAQWLELVRGDSMDLYYPEGAWVHVVDAIAIGYTPRNEDFVSVERKRQQGGLIERSLKQVALKRGKVELWPRSRNPRWNGPLPLGVPLDEDDEVRIAALVIGGYLPARR
jgi:hypothetical protein